jgi:hypothetical protein
MRDYVAFRENMKARFNIKEIQENIILEDLKREEFVGGN